MRKRILSLLLALVMVAGLLPVTALTAFAAVDDTYVRIYGTRESGGWLVDQETATVTLKNLEIKSTGSVPLELENVRELVLEGTNIITVPNGMYGVDGIDIDNFHSNYTFTISGSGSLTIKATGIGIDAFSENIQIESGTVIITSWSEGIDCSELKINGGTLSVHSEDDGNDDWGYGAISCNSFVMNGGTVDVSSTYYDGIEYANGFAIYGGSLAVCGKRDGIDTAFGDAVIIDGGTADIRSLATLLDDGKYGAIGCDWDFGPEICFSVAAAPDGFGELYDCLKGRNYYDHIKTTSSSSVRAFDFASVSPAVTNAELNAGKKNLGEMTLGSDATDIDFAAFPDNQGLSGKRSIRVYRDGTLFYSKDYDPADTSVWNLKDNITEPGKYKVALTVYAPYYSYYAYRSIVFEVNIKEVSHAFTTQPAGGEVKAGEKLTVSWKTDFTPVKQQLMGYTNNSTKTVLKDLSVSATSTAVDTAYENGYCIRAYYSADEYVDSNRFYVTEAKSFTTQPKGGTVGYNQSHIVNWATNFTPVKQELVKYSSAGSVVQTQALSAGASQAGLSYLTSGYYYRIRAYYNNSSYVESNKIYVTPDAYFTPNPQFGNTEEDIIEGITYVPNGDGTFNANVHVNLNYVDGQMLQHEWVGTGYCWYDHNNAPHYGSVGTDTNKLTFTLNNVGRNLEPGKEWRVKVYLANDYYADWEWQGYSFNYVTDTVPELKPEDNPIPVPAKPYKIANVVSGVHVYWKATAGAVKYGLWRSETGKNGTYKWVANPTVPHFTDTKVESGKTYYYKVTSMDAAGNHSEKSEAIGVTYVATPDITSRFNKAAGITVGWNKIQGATGYAIYRKSYSGTDAWVRVGTVSGNSTFTWQDTEVKNNNGTVYRYTVRALAGSDLKTLSGCRNTGRTMARLTSRVLNSAVKASATSIKCSWTTSSVVTGYEVRFMVGSTVYKTFTVGNYKTGVKTFTGLKAGQTYKIQVRSYVKIDGMGFYSAWSEAKNVKL